MSVRASGTTALAALALATSLSLAPAAKAQDSAIFRHAADFFKFDGSEFITNATAVSPATGNVPGFPNGALFYTKSVVVPAGRNVLYVSLFTTGDTHGGAAEWFSCQIHLPSTAAAVFCRPSLDTGVDQAPNGWITLLKLPTSAGNTNCNNGGGGSADCHDNGIAYQWCVPVRGGQRVTVDLRMASNITGQLVFIEKGHVYVDSSTIRSPNRCSQSPSGAEGVAASERSDPLSAALKAAAAQGDTVAGSTGAGQQQ